ncbi:MAG: hypothetical protein ACYDEN_08605 [Acidimicrobiales bacterium]
MPMREDCRHFQSRTYDDGEAARFCELGLAPEAPWRCPAGCARYEQDIGVGTFVTGSLVRSPVEDEPDEEPGDIAAVLDAAEDVVNAAGPEVVRDVERRQAGKRWWHVWRRGGPDDGDFHLSQR